MKKLIIFAICVLSFTSCVKKVTEENRSKVSYEIVIKAKESKPDTLYKVRDDYQDYYFRKNEKGEMILVERYIADEDWMDIPGPVFIFLLGVAFFLGAVIGKISN